MADETVRPGCVRGELREKRAFLPTLDILGNNPFFRNN